MPGQPSPSSSSTCSIEEHACANVEYRTQSSSSIEDDVSAGTEYRSLSSLDSLFSEVCDDPAETMFVPDAVVDSASSPSGDEPSPTLPREETDSSVLSKNGECKILDVKIDIWEPINNVVLCLCVFLQDQVFALDAINLVMKQSIQFDHDYVYVCGSVCGCSVWFTGGLVVLTQLVIALSTQSSK